MERALFDLARIGNISDLARARQWSAAELRGAVVERHATLDKAGVGPESRVVIAHGGTPELFADLFGDLDKGMNVAIHCRAGIGRSGVLASCILIRAGFSAEQAISKVGTARGIEIPDTEEQLKFIMNYAAGL